MRARSALRGVSRRARAIRRVRELGHVGEQRRRRDRCRAPPGPQSEDSLRGPVLQLQRDSLRCAARRRAPIQGEAPILRK